MLSPSHQPSNVPPLRVTHVIGSLDAGGAEHSLLSLLQAARAKYVEGDVVTLIPDGSLRSSFEQLGINVESLAMRRGSVDPRAIWQLAERLRTRRPQVVVTWMYHSNLIGGLAAKLAGGIPVVWNIRHAAMHGREKRLTRWVAVAGGRLSARLARKIVFVGRESLRRHVADGYDEARSLVIPSGFDVELYRPNDRARCEFRKELGLPESALLVGQIGRFHADKDQATFVKAAGQIARQLPQAQFVLCGQGNDCDNSLLAKWIEDNGLRGAMHLLGLRHDMPRVAAALDVAVCASAAEAFPRAVGEAMACGVPCVCTDVGDTAVLVGDTARLVPPGNAAALAAGCLELLRLAPRVRQQLGAKARERIVNHFRLDQMAAQHVDVWREVADVRALEHLRPVAHAA